MANIVFVGGRLYHRSYCEQFNNAIYMPLKEFVKFKPQKNDTIILFSSPTLSQKYDSESVCYTTYMPMLREKLHGRRVVYISSSAVYGLSVQKKPFHELCPLSGTSQYAKEKIHYEELITEVSGGSIIIRPSGFFGWLSENTKNSFLNDLRYNIMHTKVKSYDIVCGGQQLRDFSYIYDLLRFVKWAVDNTTSTHDVFNFNSTNATTIKELVETVSKKCTNIKFNFCTSSTNHIHSYLNVAKLKSTDFNYCKRSISDFLFREDKYSPEAKSRN